MNSAAALTSLKAGFDLLLGEPAATFTAFDQAQPPPHDGHALQ